jgi:hypothetical protein
MARSFLELVSAVLVLSCLPGCQPVKVKADDDQFTQAIQRIDRMTNALNKAMADITKESETWRTSLNELEKQFKKDGQDVLANEVRNILAKSIRDVDVTVMASTDYIETKLKDNLRVFRLALEHAREKVINAKQKKNVNGIQEAFDELAKIKVFPDPVVTAFIPADVHLQWKDYAQDTGYSIREPNLEVRGWGFERPEGELPRFEVFAAKRDEQGNIIGQHPLPLNALYSTTRYLMQIKLDASSVEFTPADNALVFKLGPTDLHFLPVHHERPEDPAEVKRRTEAAEQKRLAEAKPVPTIGRIVFRIHTTNEDKDPNGRVMLYLLGPNAQVLTQNGWHGERTKWHDNTNNTFEWSTQPIPAPPGTVFTARIFLENFYVNGLFKDAVKWNATWEVELFQGNGPSFGKFTGSRAFKADGTDQGDIQIVIPNVN